MSRQYYYLVAGLPDILFDDNKLSIGLVEFRDLLLENVHIDDRSIIKSFFWRYDNQNILNKLIDPEVVIDDRGILSVPEIDELFAALKDGSFNTSQNDVPEYLARFIEAFKNEESIIEGKSWDLQLSELYYEYLVSISNQFVSNWFLFERDLTNLLTAAQCRKYNNSIENQLIGKGDLIEKLLRSNARDFGIENDFPIIDPIIKATEEDSLLEQEKKIDFIKWEYLSEEEFFHYFTIEKLFSYLVRLSIIERWLALDKPTGQKLLNNLLIKMEASFKFPEEFTLKK